MTRLDDLQQQARRWWDDDPQLLQAVRDEIASAGFELDWDEPTGCLVGELPRWPLERPEPDGLMDLLPEPMRCSVNLRPTFPMLFPLICPLHPDVPKDRWTQHRWHVNGNGTLCLLQSDDAWDPRTPVSDLLRKAAAWYVEYRLVEVGVAEECSLRGIVSDDGRDGLVREAVTALAAAAGAGP